MKIKVDKRGYVIGAKCPVYHSGNHHLSKSKRGYVECAGCGSIYRETELDSLRAKEQKP